MKKTTALAGLSVLLIFAFFLLLYTLMKTPRFQIAGELYSRVNTEKKLIALTFDDGPNENADEILKILDEKNVKATFYLIGDQLEKNTDAAKKISEGGHQVGNHSYSHTRMIFKSPQFVATEIEKTNQLIRASGYEGEITFRPPYGKKLLLLPLYLKQHNIKTITWDVDPLQTLPSTTTSEDISDFVIAHAQPGSIILIHPWYGETNRSREAIAQIIEGLRQEGYQFVTVSDLLAEQVL